MKAKREFTLMANLLMLHTDQYNMPADLLHNRGLLRNNPSEQLVYKTTHRQHQEANWSTYLSQR